MKRTLLLIAMALLISVGGSAQIVINEVTTNANAWIEIANLGPAPIDISGWQLSGFWDNPANLIPTVTYAFPGAGGSGTTIIASNQCILVTENAVDPAAPMGTVRFAGINVAWFTGVPGSLLLADDLGNGIDYFAWGNTNALQAPLFLGMGTPTMWTGPGSPNIGGTASGTTAANNYRHGRPDTDTAVDWTNFGAVGTPGVLNPFQTTILNGTGILPVAAFVASRICGAAPLAVRFTNSSTGQVELSSTTWDFDAVANPGIMTATTFDATFTFNVNQSVNLMILDVVGNMSTSANTNIMAIAGAAIAPAGAPCFRQDFENFPPFVANPCGGPMIPNPSTHMEYRGLDALSRLRLVDRTVLNAALAWVIPAATPVSGNRILILDVVGGGSGTNEVIVHFDGTAIGAGAGVRIRYSLLENNDETDPQDVVAIQDGVTPGFGVINSGAATTMPGVDGFREARLLDWNAQLINRVWQRYDHVIDAAFLAANGLVLGPDMRLIIRQRDNATFEGNDGLAIDFIEVLAINATPGLGQPSVPGAALMDLNTAVNGNCSQPGNMADPNGPYFANATVGGPMNFTFSGQPNRAIILLAGTLNPGTWIVPVPGAGQVDLGTVNPLPPFIPNGLIIVVDGTQPNFLSSLFNTGPNGTVGFTFATPAFAPGIFSTFQAVIFNSASIVAMSNAVRLTIL